MTYLVTPAGHSTVGDSMPAAEVRMVGHENETLGARARRMYRQRRAWLMETGDHIYAGATEPPRLVTAWRVAVVALLVADVVARVLSYVELRGIRAALGTIRALLELPR